MHSYKRPIGQVRMFIFSNPRIVKSLMIDKNCKFQFFAQMLIAGCLSAHGVENPKIVLQVD